MPLAHILAVLAGILFGSAAISSACWVWLRKQIFAYGGSALSGAGVVLIGLSIWHSVDVKVGITSASMKLESELRQDIQQQKNSLKTVSETLAAAQARLSDANYSLRQINVQLSRAKSLAEFSAKSAIYFASVIQHNKGERHGSIILDAAEENRANAPTQNELNDLEKALASYENNAAKASYESNAAISKPRYRKGVTVYECNMLLGPNTCAEAPKHAGSSPILPSTDVMPSTDADN